MKQTGCNKGLLALVVGLLGDLVVTVDGDLDAAGLKAVAGSLRKHPKRAG